MARQYRLMSGKEINKPIDMVVIMRRIRSGKITPNTLICVDDAEIGTPAGEIEELVRFFRDDYSDDPFENISRARTELSQVFKAGWTFTTEHNIMTVYAGGLLISGIIMTIMLAGKLGFVAGFLIGWLFFITLHQFYYLFLARMYRGQTIGEDFMNQRFAPIFKSLLLSNIIYSVIVGCGLLLAVIPGIIAATFLAFMPIVMIDKQLSPINAIRQSIILVRRLGMKEVLTVYILVTLHMICIALLIPVPLTMPLFLAALCEIYEKSAV